MKSVGHLIIRREKILVLFRSIKYGKRLKLRQSGKDGIFLEDESFWLEKDPDLLVKLRNGIPISL